MRARAGGEREGERDGERDGGGGIEKERERERERERGRDREREMWEQEIIGAYEGSFPVPATQSAAPGWGGEGG